MWVWLPDVDFCLKIRWFEGYHCSSISRSTIKYYSTTKKREEKGRLILSLGQTMGERERGRERERDIEHMSSEF